jgi:hypothetical protein
VRSALLAGLIALVAVVALPASASAASCPVTPGVFATAWNGGDGNMGEENWTNGTPTGSCAVTIASPGSDTVTMTGGANMKSLTLGGTGSTPHLVISDQSPNTNLDAQPAGIAIAAGASVTLTCIPGGCPGGGPDIYSGASPFTNAGTITVDANTGGGAVVGGAIANTGTISFEKTGALSGAVTNKGAISVATGATVTNTGSSCGDTGPKVVNDTGGTISAAGTGVLSVINFEQGNGTTEDVVIPCGSLKYSGNGASQVQAFGGFNLTGEMRENQALTVFAASNNTNVFLQSDFVSKGSITLTCPASPGECSGGSGGGVGFAGNGKTFTNAGAFTVAAASGTGANVDSGNGGTIVNTGTMSFDQTARLSGVVVNKGKINIADSKVVTSAGSSCGDTGASLKNDSGGQINATGSGTLSVINYEQGAGTTSGTLPVQIPCGSLEYTGNGASKVQANGGFGLTGEMQPGQELIVSAASNNTNAVLQSDFTSKGMITLTCPAFGCSGGSGGGAGFNVNDKDFVNAGTFTVAVSSGTGAGVGANFEGTIVNTGTMNFNQSAGLGGPVTNKGPLNIADGKTVTSSGSSCGDTGSSVKNDSGGSINATGSGFLSVLNYEQGNGTTSGAAPVQIPCGSLEYTGTGAGTVQVNGFGTPLSGNIAAGQRLRLVGSVNSAPFTNAGTIQLDQSGTSPGVNFSGVLTNTGRIELAGPSVNAASLSGGQVEQTAAGAEIVVPSGTELQPSTPLSLKAGTLRGGGAINGSVENLGGVVAPGASPGTLTLSGNYTQGAGGRLEVEVAGTGVGQFDTLAIGGSATLGGTLALNPTPGYANSSAIGDSFSFLTHGGTVTGQFAQTVVNPPLPCGKAFSTSAVTGVKALNATVVAGAACPPPPPPPPPKPVPNTKLGAKPKAKVKTKKPKVKVKFTFSSDVSGATFQCKLDKGAYASCSSPKSYKVKPGKHRFSVRAAGPGGTDSTPATFGFEVVREKR